MRPANVSRWRSSAASPVAPAPSTTVFSISSSSTIACSMSPSDTSTHVVDQAQHDFPRQLARLLDGNTFGQRRVCGRQLYALECRIHRRKLVGLHADDRNVRPDRARRRHDAGDQPATTDRHAQAVDLRLLRKHLERDRALPGDHVEVVVRVHHRQPAALCNAARFLARVVEGIAGQDDFSREAARALDLHGRREPRHHDHCRNSEALRVVGDALRVVSRRYRDHAARLLLWRQQ